MGRAKEVIKNMPEISELTVLQHEIAQHFHNVHSMNELLAKHGNIEKVRDLTDQIKLQNLTALRKFNDFFDYIMDSKHYDSFTKVRLHNVDITTTVRKIHERLLELVTAEYDVNISFRSGVEAIFIATDVKRLEKILYNIVSNAVRHAPESGVRRIKWRVTDTQDGVFISIKDLSGGLCNEDEDEIFEAYKSADYSAICPATGFGLGLATSLKRAQEIGAKLFVDNTPGVGVEFLVFLPRDIETANDEEFKGVDVECINE